MMDLIKKKGDTPEDEDCVDPNPEDCFEDAVGSTEKYSGDLKAFEGLV